MQQVNKPSQQNNKQKSLKVELPNQVSMLKVLQTYKRSCEYYNSYGLYDDNYNSVNRRANDQRISTRSASRVDTDLSISHNNYI